MDRREGLLNTGRLGGKEIQMKLMKTFTNALDQLVWAKIDLCLEWKAWHKFILNKFGGTQMRSLQSLC